jgi:hypothetical protein
MDLVKADSRYVLDMSVWHQSGVNKCHVCMAGSVLAKTLGTDPEDGGLRHRL